MLRATFDWALRSKRFAALCAFAWAMGALLRGHLVFLRPPALLHAYDEAYINAFSLRMLHGHMLPYVDAVSQRGPLLYWIAAIADFLGDRWSFGPIRVCSAVATMGTLAFVFAAAWAAKKPLAGGVAAVGYACVLLLGMGTMDGLSFNGEHLLNMFAAASFFVVLLALRDLRHVSLPGVFVGGMLAMMGALSKQVGLVTVPALGVWVLAASWTRERDRRDKVLCVAAYILGALVPFGAILVRYARAGALSQLYYWTIKYNRDVYMAPFSSQNIRDALRDWVTNHVLLLAIALPLFWWGFVRALRGAAASDLGSLLRAWDRRGFTATTCLLAVTCVAASNSSLRDFTHYYVQTVPWCALLFGIVVEDLAVAQVGRHAFMAGAFFLCTCLVFEAAWDHRLARYKWERKHGGWVGLEDSPVCKFVDEHTKPSEALFVWGFMPELYTSCRRLPASRYVFTTYPAGVVPWFDKTTTEQEDAREVPGAREILMRDLEETKPPVIVDASKKTLMDRPMKRYAVLARYLDDHYCLAGKENEMPVYTRKSVGARCAPPRK